MLSILRDLPPHVAARMKAWRLCLERFPPEYIQHHEGLALQALVLLVKQWGVTLVVGSKRLVPSRDVDGMEQLRAIVTTRSGKILRLQWGDEHSGGTFFVDTGRGRSRLTVPDLT